MLKWMKLQNLALVEEAEVEFGPGFSVITGETGAGKSVIMGAVGLLLGGRADKSSIRAGADRCEISAEFDVPAHLRDDLRALFDDAAIETGSLLNSILVRRVLTKNSSRNFVNGAPVTLPLLHALGAKLIDVHAANAAQSLLHPAEQLAVLDRFGGLSIRKNEVRNAWNALAGLRAEKEEFLSSMPSESETEQLRRELHEIQQAAPEPGEDEALRTKHDLAASSRDIIELSLRAGQALTEGEPSVVSMTGDIRRILLELERADPVNGPGFVARAEEISSAVSELAEDLASHASSVELDEQEFLAMEDRMRVLQTLKRKYGPAIEDVLAHAGALEEKIAAFDNAAVTRENFDRREAALHQTYRTAAATLAKERRAAAGRLVGELSEETVKLGFRQAKFDLVFSSVPEGPGGTDQIEILFSANPGVPLCPLREVASSGEISRVMLAVKTVLADADAVPILIFDEIDANIGGETALAVGGEIAKLGKNKQIICISHLAQVARYADAHYLVSKSSEDGTTRSRILRLDRAGRVEELGRMLGGGAGALAHAKTLLVPEAPEK